MTSDLDFILYLQGLSLIIITPPPWNTPDCTSADANFPLGFPVPPLVHLEGFLSCWWYCFLVLQLEHILSHRALNYSEFLPDEVLSSNLCWVVPLCLHQMSRPVHSFPWNLVVDLHIISPPGSVWMRTQINFITHSFCILFLNRGTQSRRGTCSARSWLCKCV